MSQSADDIVTLFYEVPDLLSVANVHGFFTLLNDSWTEVLGHSKAALLSQTFTSFVHPDDLQKTNDAFKALSSETSKTTLFENRYRKADGSYVWLAWAASSKGGKIFAVAKDVTNIKDKEEFLYETQSLTKTGGWTLCVEDGTTKWTEETYRIHEIPFDTPTNKINGISFYHPDFQSKIGNCITTCIEKKTSFDDEFKFISLKGNETWVRVTGKAVCDASGKVVKLIGIIKNIGKFKNIELALRETALQLSDVLENSPGMVYQFVLEASGTMYFPFASSQTFDIYEIQPEDFKRDPGIMLSMCHPEDREDLAAKIQESAQTLQNFRWDGRIVTSSGKVKWIKAVSVPRKRENGSILWNGIVVDITFEKSLQYDLEKQRQIAQHAGRLAAIGELSAGVGHEINNPLTIVLGLIGKAKRLLANENSSREQLLEVFSKQEDACHRIRKIVDGLRTFSRKETEDENPVSNLKEAISSTLSLVSEMYLEQRIAIDTKFPDGKCDISCDIAPVQQIIMNALSNARDAVRGLADAKISVIVTSHETFWRTMIVDNGHGIPEKIAAKIFDSFFSTKPAGLGTGLGLSLSRTLMDKCGGHISFESKVNLGTTFYLDFPKVLDLGKSQESELTSKSPPRDLLSALIVDDEVGILEILADLLGHQGFDVVCSQNAMTAIELVRGREFNLIVTDMNMPEMDGMSFLGELAAQKLATNSTKFFMTGGSLSDGELRGKGTQLRMADGFIGKPFSNDELKSMIEKVLDRVIH